MGCDPRSLEPIAQPLTEAEALAAGKGPAPPDDDSAGVEGWRRVLYVMWIAQLLSIIGFMFVIPFMPFYLRDLGVQTDAAVALWAGFLGAATMLAFSVASPLWGKVADRYGRKPMVLRSMFCGAVVLTLMGLVTSPHQLLLLRIMQGLLTGTIAASTAMVSSMTPRRHLGFSLGLMQTAVFVGASLGPWLGGLTADHFGYRVPFFITGGLLLSAALLVLFLTREHFHRPDPAQATNHNRLRYLLGLPGFTTLLGIILLVHLAGTIAGPIFPLLVEHLMGGVGNVASVTGMLLAITGIMAAISATLIGRLSDRLGHKPVLVVCTLFAGVFCLPQALVGSVGQLFLLRSLLGVAAGGTGPTLNALVASLVPRSAFGRTYGLTHAVSGLGGGLGPLLGGTLAAALGVQLPFVVTGVALMLISGVAAWRVPVPAEHGAPVPVRQEVHGKPHCG